MLVVVRTYPTPSTTNRETVCTGAITDQREWRRLYPVRLRYLPKALQFKTWDVIELRTSVPRADRRPESRRAHLPTLQVLEHVRGWQARASWLQGATFGSLKEMVAVGRSLGAVAVRSVTALEATETSPEWKPRQQAALEVGDLFDKTLPLEKIPFEVRLRWVDCDNEEHLSLVIAWEMAQTWRSYRGRYADPISVMREKFLGDLLSPSRREVSLFMGNHSRRRHVFMVCGWFSPPKGEVQDALW